MLVPVLPMFEEAVNAYKAVAAAEDTTVADIEAAEDTTVADIEAAEDTTAVAKIQQAEKHIGFHNNNHRG